MVPDTVTEKWLESGENPEARVDVCDARLERVEQRSHPVDGVEALGQRHASRQLTTGKVGKIPS